MAIVAPLRLGSMLLLLTTLSLGAPSAGVGEINLARGLLAFDSFGCVPDMMATWHYLLVTAYLAGAYGSAFQLYDLVRAAHGAERCPCPPVKGAGGTGVRDGCGIDQLFADRALPSCRRSPPSRFLPFYTRIIRNPTVAAAG